MRQLLRGASNVRKRRTILIWIVAIILYILVAFKVPSTTGPIVSLIGDRWDWESWRLAGWNARDCGFVRFRRDNSHASKCVMAALQNKVPFRVRYESLCTDEACSTGLVGGRDGTLYMVSFVGGSPDGGVDLLRQQVSVRPCAEPIQLSGFVQGDEISCFAPPAWR
jgi:hypothetical protein